MHIIFGNYGNDSIALIAWAKAQALSAVTVVSVDTGWADPAWQHRVTAAHAYVQTCGFAWQRLTAQPDFTQLVQQRRAFPHVKFQWCSGILKGLTLLQWLDEYDPNATALVLLPKRRAAVRSDYDLPEYIPDNPHYAGRTVWHPLYMCDNAQRDAWVRTSPLPLLNHRSLECDPCIHSNNRDIARLDAASVARVAALEQTLGHTYLGLGITDLQLETKKDTSSPTDPAEQFALSCGAYFACGL
jgi:3'-phosphoadenosine 5'-phosphosulfate sulfotransferase (PAPS reductase)/FAD synthetase